jgi:hypothetical protein
VVKGLYSFGGAEIGVRSTSQEFGEWVDGALRSYRSPGKYQTHYSIVIAESSGDGALAKERYHILYKGTIPIIKTPDIQTLVRTFLSDLEIFLFDDRTDAIFADMNVVSLAGVNALVPGSLVPFIGSLGRRRLGRTGLRLPAETAVAIEPGTGRVIPIQPMVELTAGALDLLAKVVPGNGRDPRMVVEQPLTIDAVLSIGWGRDPLAAVSKGLGLYRLGAHLVNLELLGGEALEGVRPMVESARCYEISSAKPAEMLDGLLRMFQSA